MSTPTWARVPPKRRIFAMRMSMLLRRSPHSVAGAIRFTWLRAPVSGRPSGCGPAAIHALVTVKSARKESPGVLAHVAASCTSTFGTIYDASPRKSVR